MIHTDRRSIHHFRYIHGPMTLWLLCITFSFVVMHDMWDYKPISQIPQCIRQLSHRALFCNRTVHTRKTRKICDRSRDNALSAKAKWQKGVRQGVVSFAILMKICFIYVNHVCWTSKKPGSKLQILRDASDELLKTNKFSIDSWCNDENHGN